MALTIPEALARIDRLRALARAGLIPVDEARAQAEALAAHVAAERIVRERLGLAAA